MGETSPNGKSRYGSTRPGRLDTVAARRSLVDAAKQAAHEEDMALKAEGLHIGSSDEKVASYRGVGLGLYFKVLHWLLWMMIFMMLCSVPYLITINTSVFTDYAHRNDHGYGVKMYDSFELASFTFAAIVDDKKDNGTLQYMNTEIADAWKGPMKKGVFLTWISLLDAGATVVLTGVVVVLFVLVRRWLEKVDRKTREVSDYAVIVGGLPPFITATEVGEYFEKHFTKDEKTDKVMDVVLIRGFSTVVNACKEVHRNEQLKRFVAGMEAQLADTNSGALPPPPPPPAEAGADAADDDGKGAAAGVAAGKATPPTSPARAVPPSSPASAGPKTFNLTAVATVGAAAAPPAPLSPRPPAAEAEAVTPAAVSLDDPEAGKLEESSSMACDMSREMAKVDAAIREQQDIVMEGMRQGKLRSNAAIVTFNTEQMRAEVCRHMPSGWWASLLMPRKMRLEHGGRQWRIWVRRAAAPDDYRFENISTRIRTNICVQVLTGFIMFAFMLVCAALITWLSAESNKEARVISWDSGELRAAIGIGMAKTNLAASPSATALDQAVYDSFCSGSMGSCVAYVGDEFPGAALNMTYGSQWSFPNATARLLNERPVRQSLIKCAESVSCPASYCMPCYCLGLSSIPTDDATPEFLNHLKDACSDYWQPYDLRRQGIMIAISLVIAVINSLLSLVLRLFKFHVEKHWTTTDTELSFAVWSYLVKLINSVVVLLVVNCSTLKNLQEKALAQESRWLQRLILDGLYDDFTPDWYASIGFSVMILMMINVAGPLIRSVVDASVKWALRAKLLYGHMGKLSAPEDYNAAFRTQQFTLESRISDVLFNVTLALLFGSGMPLCYLIAAAYLLAVFWWDRAALLSRSQPAQRYNKQLPRAIIYLLPVLLLVHCAFGLWMHTYFKAELSSMDLDLVAAASQGLDRPGISSLSNNSLARRITQPNGLALLIWFLVLGTWLLFGRWILWAAEELLGGPCARLVTLLRLRRGKEPTNGQSDVSYEEALATVKVANQLRGARTYRVHHLTNYKPFLTSGEAGKLWAIAQGDRRFTRLTTFRVHVEMEVTDGRRVRTEEREVEMFDVADAPITSLPSAAAAQAAVKAAAAAAAAAAAGGDDFQLPTPQLPLPPAAPSLSSLSSGEMSQRHTLSAPPPEAADSVHLDLVPSASLQTATLQQIATLQANTGAVVKRASLRAMPEGLLLTSARHGGGAAAPAVVAPPPELPPIELDIQPVVVRSLASLRLLPTHKQQQQQQPLETARGSGLSGRSGLSDSSISSRGRSSVSCKGRDGGDGGAAAAAAVAAAAAAAAAAVTAPSDDSEPILQVMRRSASVASAASSGRVSDYTTHSAPATGPAAAAAAAGDDASGAEIAAAKDCTDGGDDVMEAAIVVQAEAIVLAEAVSVSSAAGPKRGGAAKAGKPAGLGGGSFGGGGGGGVPAPSSLKARAAAVAPRSGGGAVAARGETGPRARASMKYSARPSPLELLTKQLLRSSGGSQLQLQLQQQQVAQEVVVASAIAAGDAADEAETEGETERELAAVEAPVAAAETA
ncbi:hypothetical protein PLESTM_000084200 [Pleodorina starrii]|nr:hypothetical protein PLESTM_000084200 [Pleodorina starrii]